MNAVVVQMGDVIEVCGRRFVLVEFTEKLDEPAKVTFTTPAELLEEENRT